MARIFKPTYPKPLPADAKILQHNGRPHAQFRDRRGKLTMAPLTEDGQRVLLETQKWYVEYRDSSGLVRRKPGYTDKKATDQLAAKLERRAAHQAEGLIDPYEDHRKRPLPDHLEEFRSALSAKGNTPDYVTLVLGRLRTLVEGCGWRTLNDLSASQASAWLAQLRVSDQPARALPEDRELFTLREACGMLRMRPGALRAAVARNRLAAVGQGKARRFPHATVQALLDRQGQGVSVQTTNAYQTHLKTFGSWLVKDRRISENPFRHLEGGNEQVDRRHDRRELEAEELRRLLTVTRDNQRVFRGLTGPDRCALYAAACGTGFRASALASLTPESFDLHAETPTVTLAAQEQEPQAARSACSG